jgi:hypothetical protein
MRAALAEDEGQPSRLDLLLVGLAHHARSYVFLRLVSSLDDLNRQSAFRKGNVGILLF